jgi:hypothetical protein
MENKVPDRLRQIIRRGSTETIHSSYRPKRVLLKISIVLPKSKHHIPHRNFNETVVETRNKGFASVKKAKLHYFHGYKNILRIINEREFVSPQKTRIDGAEIYSRLYAGSFFRNTSFTSLK